MKQNQKSGDNSVNIQANEITYSGLSYSEAKEIATDVFEQNFYKLSAIAGDIAKKRAEEITDKFLAQLAKECPEALQNCQDPDFQYALFEVQKSFARSGSDDLADMLVDLLLNRASENQGNITQIVLNESLQTVPKLTNNQIRTLSLIFDFYHRVCEAVSDELFTKYLKEVIEPLLNGLTTKDSDIRHLIYTGCVIISPAGRTLMAKLRDKYYGLFVKGFDENEATVRGFDIQEHPKLFTRCINDETKWQINALTYHEVERIPAIENFSSQQANNFTQLSQLNLMQDSEVRQKCNRLCPFMEKLFNDWDKSALKNIKLTSVGIAIAHSYLKKYHKNGPELTTWIS